MLARASFLPGQDPVRQFLCRKSPRQPELGSLANPSDHIRCHPEHRHLRLIYPGIQQSIKLTKFQYLFPTFNLQSLFSPIWLSKRIYQPCASSSSSRYKVIRARISSHLLIIQFFKLLSLPLWVANLPARAAASLGPSPAWT